MNEMELFQKLAAKARGESPPPVDVAFPVLRAIHERSERPGKWDMATKVFTGFSAAAAGVVAVFSVQTWALLQDPLAGFFSALSMVMP